MKTSTLVIVGVAVAMVALITFAAMNKTTTPGVLDGFAQCIADKGAKFYGAFWCPHCQKQKALFGGSAKLLPYVECSLPDGKTRTQVCIDQGIESYPTWILSDDSRLTGAIELEVLAEKTGCELPQ